MRKFNYTLLGLMFIGTLNTAAYASVYLVKADKALVKDRAPSSVRTGLLDPSVALERLSGNCKVTTIWHNFAEDGTKRISQVTLYCTGNRDGSVTLVFSGDDRVLATGFTLGQKVSVTLGAVADDKTVRVESIQLLP